MAIDNDLSALLPEPPPPRPARREVAIEEALRRFDAGGEQAPTPHGSARPAPVRKGWGRPQIAALASVALVLLVSVPIWLSEKDRYFSGAPQAPPPVVRNSPGAAPAPEPRAPQQTAATSPRPAQAERAEPSAPAASTTLPSSPPMAVRAPPATASFESASPRPEARDEVSARRVSEPAQAAAAARPAPSPEVSQGAIMVTGSRIARPDFESNSPIVSVDESLLADGDWNACTLLDPRRDVSACRAFADPAARGATGRAAAQLADGLTLAWRGDLDRAIDAFDRAIRAAPDLSIAHLNRGLAYQSKGDLRRALTEFNRAVARDPDSARGYYHRSLFHRAEGDTARADADAKRAIELDPRYQAVLP